MVVHKTEKYRLNRSMDNLNKLMRKIRHYKVKDQVKEINQILRGHHVYYELGGNHKSLWKTYRFAERYWHKMLCGRSRKRYMSWEKFNLMK